MGHTIEKITNTLYRWKVWRGARLVQAGTAYSYNKAKDAMLDWIAYKYAR